MPKRLKLFAVFGLEVLFIIGAWALIIHTAHAQIGLDFLNLPANFEIGDLLARLYIFGVGVVAVLAVIMLVIGGVQYMVAGDKDPGPAKERIKNAIWGLILALTSYLILYTINPDLVKKVVLKPIEINLVPPTATNKIECKDASGTITCFVGTGCPKGSTPTGAPNCSNPTEGDGLVARNDICDKSPQAAASQRCQPSLTCMSPPQNSNAPKGVCCNANEVAPFGSCVPK